jgi:hypothetical protein
MINGAEQIDGSLDSDLGDEVHGRAPHEAFGIVPLQSTDALPDTAGCCPLYLGMEVIFPSSRGTREAVWIAESVHKGKNALPLAGHKGTTAPR